MRPGHRVLRISKLLLVLPAALLSSAVAAGNEVHRCIDEGRVTYADRACGDQSEVVSIATMASVSLAAREPPAPYVQTNPVTVGMSPRRVFDTLGRPYETVATLEGRSLVEYWVYRGPEGRTRVAFQEGRVTRIDSR